MRVFITGGTGLVGSRLVKRLHARGDKAVVLSRRAETARKALGPDVEVVEGDPMKEGPWQQAVAGCDAVINLVGENVFGKRWNAEFKQLLVDSRVKATGNVARAAAGKVLVSASAIGIYGPHGDEEINEDSPPGEDFMADLCVKWERASREGEASRVANVRIGIVLDRKGGALAQMVTPFWLGAGGPIGSGRQYMAWIHHADLLGLLLLALDDPRCVGPINGTAPKPVTNKAFGHALGRAMWRPSFMWTPGFMLSLMLGESAKVVLAGQRVVPAKALALGYKFEYPEIDAALAEIFKK